MDSSAYSLANSETSSISARQAPCNLEMEQQLLGAILLNNETFYRISDFLEPVHFFDQNHQAIFETISVLIRSGKIASPLTLKSFMPDDKQIAGLSPVQYLLRLTEQATTIINSEDYGRHLRDLSVRRSLIRIGEDVVNIAFDAPVDMPARNQIEDAERRLFELGETGKFGSNFYSFSDALTESIEMAEAAYQRDGNLSGISTGLHDLDERMGGLQRSDLIVLAARPAMGKSALVTNIAFHVAKNFRAETGPDGQPKTVDGGIVGFFSLEMSAEQLTTRIVSEQAEISSEKLRRGKINDNEFLRLVDTAKELQNYPIHIDQTGGLSISQLAIRARRLKRERGLDLLIVDYLQLLAGSSQKSGGNRVQELTEITTGLKALAKELDVPIIALSQLSRTVETRDDKRPQLSDLRESGSIEQDADIVMFIYREEYYLEKKMPEMGTEAFIEWQGQMDRATGKAEVIISKQRHGPTGTVYLQFTKEYTRFSDLAVGDRLPDQND